MPGYWPYAMTTMEYSASITTIDETSHKAERSHIT
jgi:hypothetical protein